MDPEPTDGVVDILTLRFVGEEEDGTELHELRAAHVAEVLQGVVGLTGDFARAGAFGDGLGTEVLVRPAQEGSFILEVVRTAAENPYVVSGVVGGVPSLSSVVWWATKSVRASVKDYEHQENGKVKVYWQDDTVDEIPLDVWNELSKRKRKRKKQLREIMTPLSDGRVDRLEVSTEPPPVKGAPEPTPRKFALSKGDYEAAKPEDDIEEQQNIFVTEAQMSAIDFDNAEKWRVKTKETTRTATVEDKGFLGRIASSLAIRKSDIFNLRIREDITKKNGHTQRKWTVLEVISHRRATHDDDA